MRTRWLLVVALVGCAACSNPTGDDDALVDAGPGATADAAGECTPPTTGHYAISQGPLSTRLYLIGDGADAWDADLGELKIDGQPLPFQTITSKAGAYYLSASGGVYTFDPMVRSPDGSIPVALDQIYSPSFTAFSADPDAIAAEDRSIYCIAGDTVYAQGLAITGAFTEILAITGSCDPMVNGPVSAVVYAWSGTASRRITLRRTGATSDIDSIGQSEDLLHKITGVHFDADADGDLVVTEEGLLGHVLNGVFTSLRSTRACLEPGNPFQGHTLSVGGME